MATTDLPTPETDVPDGAAAPQACPYCERPFATERERALHLGEQHPDALSEAERTAYDDAREQERDDLWLYHVKVIVGLGVTYTGMVILYTVVMGSGLV